MSNFVRIPPDSTGKRIRHKFLLDIVYSNATILLDSLNEGDVLTGNISGVSGKLSSIDQLENNIFLEETTGQFTNNEDLLYNGNIVCKVVSSIELHTPIHHIADYRNPDNVLKIDKEGSLYTRHKEGNQPFDAFGYSQMSTTNRIADHVFTYNSSDFRFFNETEGGGLITQHPEFSYNRLSVDSASASVAKKTSMISYPYVPGYGTFMSVSISCGDNGKDNVVRRWGLYDDEDGVFFELDGTQFSVNVRSSLGGTIQVNKVLMQDFDTLLDYDLDFSKFNLYWIDFQWQGVGRVRFGVFNPDGSREVLHTIKNANSGVKPYMKRGTLPFKISLFNKADTSSSSELLLTCLSVVRQGGETALITSGESHLFVTETPITVNSTTLTPIVTARPKLIFNGVTNRVVGIPLSFEVVSDVPVRMDIMVNCSLTGTSYSVPSNVYTAFDLDESATSMSGGSRMESVYFPQGTSLRKFDESLTNTLGLLPNKYQPTLTFSIKSVNPGATGSVSMIFRWKEAY